MLALKVASEEKVREIYQLAIRLNSVSEVEPGLRNNDAYFAAYLRDLDGNKIAVFCRDYTDLCDHFLAHIGTESMDWHLVK